VKKPGVVHMTVSWTNELLEIDMYSGQVSKLVRNDWNGMVNRPQAIDTDSKGNLFVIDGFDFLPDSNRIQVFDYKGNYSMDFIKVPSLPARYKLNIDNADKIHISAVNGSTSIYDTFGTLLGSFNFNGLDVALDDANYYVLGSSFENLISVYSKQGELVRVIPDVPESVQNYLPVAIEVAPNGNIVVAKTNELLVFANDGTFIKRFGSYGTDNGSFLFIRSLHIDSKGYIYVGDYYSVQIFDSEGNFMQHLGGRSSTDATSFYFVSSMAVHNNRLFISDFSNRVQIYSTLPFIHVADKQVNYKDMYHFLPEETADGNRITYKIKEGTAASLSFGNMLDLNSAGEVIMDASVEASPSISKSTYEFKVTVQKAMLSLTALNKEKVYGEVNPPLSIQSPYYSAMVDGLRGDDDLIEIDELPVITSVADETSTVGSYPITFSGGFDDNYDFEFTPGTLTVTKATLQLVADNKERQYGDANPELTYSVSGFKNGDDVSDLDSSPLLSTTTTLTSAADTYPITVNIGPDNNYHIQTASGELIVTKAPLQVKAHDATRAYGEPNPVFSVEFEGFKNSDNQDVLNSIPVPYSEADFSSPVGQYAIVFGTSVDARYEYTLTQGTLTIVKADQQITFLDLPSPIDSDTDPFTVGTYASVTSNLPISFSVVSGPATISGSLVTLTGEGGIVTIQATQPGNSNYYAAEPVSKTFEVNLVTAINEEQGGLKIYPNPVQDALKIVSAAGIKYQLINSNGVSVMQSNHSFVKEHVIVTEALSEGVYLLRLQAQDGSTVTRKISVIR
jgi:hypothetical protein